MPHTGMHGGWSCGGMHRPSVAHTQNRVLHAVVPGGPPSRCLQAGHQGGSPVHEAALALVIVPVSVPPLGRSAPEMPLSLSPLFGLGPLVSYGKTRHLECACGWVAAWAPSGFSSSFSMRAPRALLIVLPSVGDKTASGAWVSAISGSTNVVALGCPFRVHLCMCRTSLVYCALAHPVGLWGQGSHPVCMQRCP